MDNITRHEEMEDYYSPSSSISFFYVMTLVANLTGIVANIIIVLTLVRCKPMKPTYRLMLNWSILDICQLITLPTMLSWYGSLHDYVNENMPVYLFTSEIITIFFYLAFGYNVHCLVLMLLFKTFKVYDEYCVVTNIFAMMFWLLLFLTQYITFFVFFEWFVIITYGMFLTAIIVGCCVRCFWKTWDQEHMFYLYLAIVYAIFWIPLVILVILYQTGTDMFVNLHVVFTITDANSVLNLCLFLKMDKSFRMCFLTMCQRKSSDNDSVGFISENE